MDNERFYLEIINNIREGAYFTDQDRKILFWNKAAEEITGFKKEEILGKCCQETQLEHIDVEGNKICKSGCPLHFALLDGNDRRHDVFLKNSDKKRISVSIKTFPVKEDGEIVGAIEIFTPSSLVIYDEELITELANSAMNDRLTGIPNRRRTESFLDLRLREMVMYKFKVCVVFLDIDNFRDINNTFGHDVGDTVLKEISSSVTHMTRSTDLFGRWGGEEFIGVYAIKDGTDAALIGEKVRATIEKTQIRHGDLDLSVTASVGAVVAKEGDTIESVIKRADELMYISKEKGKNRVTSEVE